LWYRALAIASLNIFGLWWCYTVITRFRQDVREIFELKEVARILVIIFVWIITIPILLGLILYGYVLVGRLVWFVRTL